MMTDTEAMFAMMPDTDIVQFIKDHWRDRDWDYETTCACRVMGHGLLDKHGLYAIWRAMSWRWAERGRADQ